MVHAHDIPAGWRLSPIPLLRGWVLRRSKLDIRKSYRINECKEQIKLSEVSLIALALGYRKELLTIMNPSARPSCSWRKRRFLNKDQWMTWWLGGRRNSHRCVFWRSWDDHFLGTTLQKKCWLREEMQKNYNGNPLEDTTAIQLTMFNWSSQKYKKAWRLIRKSELQLHKLDVTRAFWLRIDQLWSYSNSDSNSSSWKSDISSSGIKRLLAATAYI